jgi:predicted nucleic acid-binding Zn ribbon protein
MKKGKDNKDFVHIGSVINNVLTTCRNDCDQHLAQIWGLWGSAVGDNIAKNTRPEAFKGKLLLVHVSSSTWLHQLQFLKQDIIKKVNEALGNTLIEEIKFKVGPV